MKRLAGALAIIWALANLVVAYLFLTNAFVAKTAFEVQVGVVLPGEADAAEDLHAVLRALEERIGHERAGDRRGEDVLVVGVRGTSRVDA